jgi:hypothetical protein
MNYFYLYLFLFPFLCFSQVSDTVFYNFYGGPNQEEAKDFIETADKGFLICGSSSSFGQGASSVYLIKTDSNGVFKWSRTYGGINADRGMSIKKTSSNGAIISGYTNSFNNLEYDVFYLKIDSAGNIIWQKTFTENDWEFAYSSALLDNDELIIAGETYSGTNGNSDGLLLKIKSNGDVDWVKKIGFQNQDAFRSVTYLNGFIYAAGYYTTLQNEIHKGFILKLLPNGVIIDTLFIHSDDRFNYKLNSINNFNENALIIAGEIERPDSILPQSEFRLKIDTSLNIIWRDSAQFSTTKKGEYIFKHPTTNHLMSVYTLNGGNGKTAVFLADYTDYFYYNFGSTYGGLEEEQGVKGLLSSRNKLVYLGNTKTWGFGDQDFWLIMFKGDSLISDQKTKNKFYTDTTSLSPINIISLSNNEVSKIYPNPVSKNGTLQLKSSTLLLNSKIEITDAIGKCVLSKSLTSSEIEKIQLSQFNLNAGCYVLKIVSSEIIQQVKLIVTD